MYFLPWEKPHWRMSTSSHLEINITNLKSFFLTPKIQHHKCLCPWCIIDVMW